MGREVLEWGGRCWECGKGGVGEGREVLGVWGKVLGVCVGQGGGVGRCWECAWERGAFAVETQQGGQPPVNALIRLHGRAQWRSELRFPPAFCVFSELRICITIHLIYGPG